VQAIQDLFRTGEMYFDFFAFTLGPDNYSMFQGVPNAHFVQAYGDIIEGEVRGRSWADQLDNRGTTPLSGGYQNFLKDAICFFYRRGQIRDAAYWHWRLRTYDKVNLNERFTWSDEMSLPLDEFVNNELHDRATSPNVAVSQIAGALMGAYTSGLLNGDQELFDNQFEYSKRFHKYFFEQQRRAVVVNRQYVRMDQMEPDFRLAAGAVYSQWIQTLGLDDARAVYGRSPLQLKQFSYDIMRNAFEKPLDEHAKLGSGEPFAKLFPEPDGMTAFRTWMKEQMAIRSQNAVDAQQQ